MARRYVEESISRTWHTLARHIEELRAQYKGRYKQLRSGSQRRSA
ncbi:hypothetical protein [Streptomyces werraensis]